MFTNSNEIFEASTSRSNPTGKRCTGFGSSSSKGLFDSLSLSQIRYPQKTISFPSLSSTHSPSINTPIIGESIIMPQWKKSSSELVKALNLKLPQLHVGDKMRLYVRSITCNRTPIDHSFWITNIVMARLKNAYKSLGLVRKPFTEVDTPTHLTEKLVIKPMPKKRWLIEVFTSYQGIYGHFLVLVCFGVSCTVWYTMGQNLHDIVPPYEMFNPEIGSKLPNLQYGFFMSDDYVPENFKKLDF